MSDIYLTDNFTIFLLPPYPWRFPLCGCKFLGGYQENGGGDGGAGAGTGGGGGGGGGRNGS